MELIHSTKINNINQVRILLADNIEVNIQDENGYTALMHSIIKGFDEISCLLLNSNNIDINIQNNNGDTALIRAAINGNKEISKLLLINQGIDVNIQNNHGNTALICAVINGYKEIFDLLLNNNKVNVNIRNKDGDTALICAITYDYKELLELMINIEKIDVNIQNNFGDTALIRAINNGHKEISKLLLFNHTINVNIQNNDGDSTLIRAVRFGCKDTTELLLNIDNIDINIQNKNGDTALILAVIKDDLEISELLLNNKYINPNIRDKEGNTALIWTVNRDNIDVNIQNQYGTTALMWAARYGFKEISDLLLSNHEINVNIQNKKGYSALILAVINGNKEISKQLLNNNKVDINIQDNNGNTALTYSLIKGYVEISELLLMCLNINVNIQNKNGSTALTEAVLHGRCDIAILLITRTDIKTNIKSRDMLRKRSNGNVLLHEVLSNRSCVVDVIRNIIRICPSCVDIKNNDEKTPLDVAVDNELSIEIIATLILNSTTSLFFSRLSTSKYSSHPVYGPLVRLLQTTSYDSVVRLHLCGYEGAGKTTLRHCIKASLSNFFNSNIDTLNAGTIGMDITSFTDNRVKFVVFDYGGQSEYHVNHSRFLRGNNSIFVIVLNLCHFRDTNGERLKSPVPLTKEELSDLGNKYNYWLKFVNVGVSTKSGENLYKAHVITSFNCNKSLISSGSNIMKLASEVILGVQNEWLNLQSLQNGIYFVNEINVVNMLSTKSVNDILIPLFRSKAFEIANASTIFILVDNILSFRDKEKWFDIGPRSEFISLIMSKFPSNFPNNIKNGLAEVAISQLEMIGEIFSFNHSDTESPLVVSNPNKLSSNVLGELAKYLKQKLKEKEKFVDFETYSVSRQEIADRVNSTITFCEGFNEDVVLQLLELLGVCIKRNDENWFPVFAANNGIVQETNIFTLPDKYNINSRRVHRRYKLIDNKLQMFPPGYFPSLFVYIAAMAEKIEGNFQLYSNSILIPEGGRAGEDGLPHMETILKISEDRSYFDVIVQSWSLDSIGESRYWTRLNDIKVLLFDQPKFKDYYHVNIEEWTIHPDPENQKEEKFENIEKCLNTADDSNQTNSIKYWPWLFGIDGIKRGINCPSSKYNKSEGSINRNHSATSEYQDKNEGMLNQDSLDIQQLFDQQNESINETLSKLTSQLSELSSMADRKIDMLSEIVLEINDKTNGLLRATNELLERYDKMPRTLIIKPKTSKVVDPNASSPYKIYKYIKGKTYGKIYDLLWNKTVVIFVCPITRKIVPCGPRNKGYVINIPTDLLRKLAPAFKWGLIFLKLALATQGLGGIIPSLDADAMPSSPIDLDYLKSLSAAFANNNAMVTDLNHGSQNIINALFDSNSDFSNLDDLLGNNSNFALNTAYDKIYNLLRKEENLPYGAALQCTGLYPYKRYNKYENPEYLWVSKEGAQHFIQHGIDPNFSYSANPFTV